MADIAYKIIFFVRLYPIVPLISLLMANEAKVKKNIILGVTLPYAAQHDKRVEGVAHRYKRAQWLWCGAASAVFIAACLLGGDNGVLVATLVLLPVVVFVP